MAEDLKFELSILATVQGFYQKLLRDSLGGDVPIPRGLDELALCHSDHDLPETLSRMYRWLHLLDMAITPASGTDNRRSARRADVCSGSCGICRTTGAPAGIHPKLFCTSSRARGSSKSPAITSVALFGT